ncbi:MAG: GTP-binding protein [Thermoplasmata archaeon]|nr:MAG: GTP-binding protein [Thermoplasmata archaeon]
MTNLKEIQKKIILLGDGAVGKTSLIRRFVVDKFDDEYIVTIGSKITAKDLQMNVDGGMIYLKLQIWDILGQKGYTKLHNSSFRGTDGVFFVADITRKETLENLESYWIPEVQNIAGTVPFVIMANKSDLIRKAEFNENELKSFASKHKAPFYLTSAKSGENVKRAFEAIGRRMLKLWVVEPPRPTETGPMDDKVSDISIVIDKIMDDFCQEYGDLEDAMPVLRKQFELAELDLNHPTEEALRRAVGRLAMIEKGYKKKEIADINYNKRIKWIEGKETQS